MKLHSARSDGESQRQSRVVPWRWLEQRAGSAFAVGGALLLASLVVPVGLAALASWASASGIVLVGIAVLALASGLLGALPSGSEGRRSGLATAGTASVAVAGAGALGLTAMGIVALSVGAAGLAVEAPKAAFTILALATATGLALALVAVGVARWRTDGGVAATPALLTAGGALLLVPVLGQLARLLIGVAPPPWLLFPVLVGVAIDALAVGVTLRRADRGDGSRSTR